MRKKTSNPTCLTKTLQHVDNLSTLQLHVHALISHSTTHCAHGIASHQHTPKPTFKHTHSHPHMHTRHTNVTHILIHVSTHTHTHNYNTYCIPPPTHTHTPLTMSITSLKWKKSLSTLLTQRMNPKPSLRVAIIPCMTLETPAKGHG